MWRSSDYFLSFRQPADLTALAETVYPRVLRTDFTQPGFCLIACPEVFDSFELRRWMVELKDALDIFHRQRNHRCLQYLSLGRFDQQTTTRPHRDNAPDESILMLGYEPTTVAARVAMYDYTKCASDNGMTPDDWLTDHNPMYVAGEQLLANYRTVLDAFDSRRFQILLVNNSVLAMVNGANNLLGVLHMAEIPHPDLTQPRIVNSTMIGTFPEDVLQSVDKAEIHDFLTTEQVSERMYA